MQLWKCLEVIGKIFTIFQRSLPSDITRSETSLRTQPLIEKSDLPTLQKTCRFSKKPATFSVAMNSKITLNMAFSLKQDK